MSAIFVGKNGKSTVGAVARKMQQQANVCELFTKRDGSKFWKRNGVHCKKNGRHCSGGIMKDQGGVTINFAFTESHFTTHSGVVYNAPEAIKRSSDKALSRRLFEDNWVPTLHAYSTAEAVPEDVQFPVIARPRYHRAGKGFFVCNNREELGTAVRAGCAYYSKLYPKTKEYRVHVAHGKVLVLQEKTGTEEQKQNILWNHAEGGFVFQVVPWDDYRARICKPAVDAVKAVGLDFGAVDILAYPEPRNDLPVAVVCEINTSPSLCGYTSERYAKYFDWLLRSETRREHFDHTGWEAGKSYAFKNFQLEQ